MAPREAGQEPCSSRSSLPLGAASLLLSFGTMLDLRRAKGFDATIGLRLASDTYVLRIHDGKLRSRRGDLDDVDVTLGGEPTAIGSVVYGGRPLPAAMADGGLTVEGDRTVAKTFVTLLPLPAR